MKASTCPFSSDVQSAAVAKARAARANFGKRALRRGISLEPGPTGRALHLPLKIVIPPFVLRPLPARLPLRPLNARRSAKRSGIEPSREKAPRILTFSYVKYAKVRTTALFLVGGNIDKSRSHYQAETGKLVQLMRGVYVDAGDDIDAMVMKHAVRIARYLYPHAYLSAASAVLLGPNRDGACLSAGAASSARGCAPLKSSRTPPPTTRPSRQPSSTTAWGSSPSACPPCVSGSSKPSASLRRLAASLRIRRF